MAGFETARAETVTTCGPELQGNGYALDTNGTFNNAKKSIEGKMGFIDKKLGGVDKQFDKITNALQQRGRSACGDVLKAVEGAQNGPNKGEIVLNAPKASITQTAQSAPAAAPNTQTAQMDVRNISTYAGGTSRTDRLMKEMGI